MGRWNRLLAAALLAVASVTAAAQTVCKANLQSCYGTLSAADTGACTTAGGCVTQFLPDGTSSLGLDLGSGLTGTSVFEATAVDQNNQALNWVPISCNPLVTGTAATSTTAAGEWICPVGGMKAFRIRASVVGSGSASVSINASSAAASIGATTAVLGASLPSGSNVVGKFGIDQTTPGTTNAVQATNLPTSVATGTGAQGASSPRVTVATDPATVAGSASLPAGSNLVGKFGIDQTTPGTTNGVQVNAALPAGSNTIGAITGPAAEGAAASGNPIRDAGWDGTNLHTRLFCSTHGIANNPASGATQLIAAVGGKQVYVTNVTYANNSTGVNAKLVTGTGSNCGTGTADLTMTFPTGMLTWDSGDRSNDPWVGPVGAAVCFNGSAAIAAGGIDITVCQF